MNALKQLIDSLLLLIADTLEEKRLEVAKRTHARRTKELRDMVRAELETRMMQAAIQKKDIEENPYESENREAVSEKEEAGLGQGSLWRAPGA